MQLVVAEREGPSGKDKYHRGFVSRRMNDDKFEVCLIDEGNRVSAIFG